MAFKVSNNIVIDDNRNLVNIEGASLTGILTASNIKTAENGNITVGAGGSITADALFAVVGGESVGVATISDSGESYFNSLSVTSSIEAGSLSAEGTIQAGKFVGVGSELTYLASASITTSITPTARQTGEELQDGDLWFDTTADVGGVRQYTYYDGQWIDSNAAPILTNLVVKNGSTSEEVDFGGGSLDILGGSNISVALAGVGSTATFTANLNEHISLTGMELSGIATMATMKFGAAGQEVTTIVTDFSAPSDAQLPTAQAVKSAIDNVQGSVDSIDITGADFSGVDFVAQSLSADSLTIGSAETPELATGAFSTINTNLSVAGEVLEAENVAISSSLSFPFSGSQIVDEITTDLSGTNTDNQLPTALAVKTAVDAVATDLSNLNIVELDRIQVAGISTFQGQAKADAAGIGLTVADSAFIGGALNVGGATTLGSLIVEGATQVEALTVKGDLIVENTATQINFNVKDVAVDDRLIELGTEDGAAPSVATSHDLGISLNYNDGAAKRSALVWSNNAAFNLAAEISDDGADDVNITIAAHAALGVGSLYMGDAETAGNLAIDASKNATLANIEASGSFTFGGTAFASVETSLTGSATAIPTAEAVFNFVETATESVGTASSITLTEDAETNDTYFIPFAPDASGDTQLRTDQANLYYNPSSGTLTAQVVDTLSDINYKENIELISEPMAKVEALRGVNFDWKDGSGSSAGVIAQEVQAVMPSLITEHQDKITVNYNGLVGLLVEAVKELSAEVAQLKAAQ